MADDKSYKLFRTSLQKTEYNPSVDDYMKAYEFANSMAKEYQDELDRRKKYKNNYISPDNYSKLTNKDLRELIKFNLKQGMDQRKQASMLNLENLKSQFDGNIPINDYDIQKSYNKNYDKIKNENQDLSDRHKKFQADNGIEVGDVYIAGNVAYSPFNKDYYLDAVVPERLENENDNQYGVKTELHRSALLERVQKEGFLNDLNRWAMPVSRGITSGLDDSGLALTEASIAKYYGGDFSRAFQYSLIRSAQERRRLAREHPVWNTTGEGLGMAAVAAASGGGSLVPQIAVRSVAADAVKSGLSNAVQAAVTTPGTWDDKAIAAARGGANGILSGAFSGALPRGSQNVFVGPVVSLFLDEMTKGNSSAYAHSLVDGEGSIPSSIIYRKDGKVERSWPEIRPITYFHPSAEETHLRLGDSDNPYQSINRYGYIPYRATEDTSVADELLDQGETDRQTIFVQQSSRETQQERDFPGPQPFSRENLWDRPAERRFLPTSQYSENILRSGRNSPPVHDFERRIPEREGYSEAGNGSAYPSIRIIDGKIVLGDDPYDPRNSFPLNRLQNY